MLDIVSGRAGRVHSVVAENLVEADRAKLLPAVHENGISRVPLPDDHEYKGNPVTEKPDFFIGDEKSGYINYDKVTLIG